jgi:hypothetical protein
VGSSISSWAGAPAIVDNYFDDLVAQAPSANLSPLVHRHCLEVAPAQTGLARIKRFLFLF